MKTLVIGLSGAAPEVLFGDDRLHNIRRLMDAGSYGRLESTVPPTAVPAWVCMATSQDPGSLGVYGLRNRVDHSYDAPGTVDARSICAPALWDQVAREGKRSIIVGVPPGYPAREVNGISVGCHLTPDPGRNGFTHPAEIRHEIEALVGSYPLDVKGFRTRDKSWLRDEIRAMTRAHFKVVRHLLGNQEWDYFQFVEIGLDRVQRGFWKQHDPAHVLHEPDGPFRETVRDGYRLLDEEIGTVLELLTEDTNVLVVSDHGARPLDGGFCVNEWLVREGLLVLNSYPEQVTPFCKLDVNWDETRAWSDGGHAARVYFNVAGREPRGAIAPGDYERFRDEIKARLEATSDADGRPLGAHVFKPEEVYRQVRNIAPDLIAHFGGLSWRSVGGVGYSALHVREDHAGLDGCNPSRHGAYILAGSNVPADGTTEGAHLLDIAPTLLELGGYDVPPSMQGRSLTSGRAPAPAATGDLPTEEDMVRERLCGLGYI